MLFRIACAGLLAATISTGALAQGAQPSPAQAAQQERMKTCNTEAGSRTLSGDARRDFMSACLAGTMPPAAKAPSAAQAAQQDRMKTCNAEAGSRTLSGDARREFMSACLSGNMPAAAKR